MKDIVRWIFDDLSPYLFPCFVIAILIGAYIGFPIYLICINDENWPYVVGGIWGAGVLFITIGIIYIAIEKLYRWSHR